ncbi:MAG: hypothetical protein KJ072_25940 [Verrucomicrobia bacterium]|nr:hypothetical protein [Verrucomicrobiota bacterium]
MNNCNTPGSAKAWFREHVTIPRRVVDEEAVWRLCARARMATTIEEQAQNALQLLGLGQLTDPGLNQAADDAFAILNGQAGAPLRLPVLSAGRPEEIVNWCRYILTQPMERAIELSSPLHRVIGNLTNEAALAVGQVLRWAMLGERHEQ